MFMLYGVVIGLAAGSLLGGRVGNLAGLRIGWLWAGVAALAIQVVIFIEPFMSAMGGLLAPAYVLSTALALAVILRNVMRLPGLAIVALGAVCNLVAIVANGGYMPVTAEALGSEEPAGTTHFVNAVFTRQPAFEPLIDRFRLPGWLPLTNVFSIGDVLITAGIVIVIVMAMRRAEADPGLASPSPPPEPAGPQPRSRPSATAR